MFRYPKFRTVASGLAEVSRDASFQRISLHYFLSHSQSVGKGCLGRRNIKRVCRSCEISSITAVRARPLSQQTQLRYLKPKIFNSINNVAREVDEKCKTSIKNLASRSQREYIYTLPNILTFSRLFAAPIIGYLVLHDHHTWAISLFTYAGITDLIDGWIARRWKLQTVVGTVIDPMADKTLMTILTVCLGIKGSLPVWLAGIILGRDVGLALTAIYYRWISLPLPRTFVRYWDFSLPSAEVRPTTISKYNTALQFALIGATTAMPLITIDISSAMTVMQYLVASTTIVSGASYIFSKDAVKILNHKLKISGKSNEKN
ncbi:putative cardiolipin synthase [Golovinomyces cichoracearum]|uniref:Putative cardiolipin synthase n=1 Tax=Golovinomyces cichoracearum TaxID=62708 RepID=A0A420IYB0_9PEZI|nr:putative cardiolipin synthase [Golovinomyces cichoracearum]